MNMPKNHTPGTPGPWVVGDRVGEGECFVEINTSKHGALATVVVRMSGDDSASPHLLANANLIAASPELLDVLQEALDQDGGVSYDCDEDSVGTHTCCGGASYNPHKPHCWVPKARALVAKVQS